MKPRYRYFVWSTFALGFLPSSRKWALKAMSTNREVIVKLLK